MSAVVEFYNEKTVWDRGSGLLLSGNAYSKDGSGDLRFTSQSS